MHGNVNIKGKAFKNGFTFVCYKISLYHKVKTLQFMKWYTKNHHICITKPYQTSPINYYFFPAGKSKRIAPRHLHPLRQNSRHSFLFPVE